MGVDEYVFYFYYICCYKFDIVKIFEIIGLELRKFVV